MAKQRKFEQHAAEVYPGCQAQRPAGFATADEGRAVLIASFDDPHTVLVIEGRDLTRLKAVIETAELSIMRAAREKSSERKWRKLRGKQT